MQTRQFIISLVAVCILGGSYFLMEYFESLKKDPEKKEVPVPKRYVKTQAVKYSEIPTEIITYGRVISSQPLDVASEVSGRMLPGSVPLKAGQKFSKGAILFKIDDGVKRLNLQSQKSDLLKMIASTLPDFKIDFPESFSTWQAYFKSIKLDQPVPEIPMFQSEKEKTYLATKDIYKTYYSIKSAEEELEKYQFFAPYNGSISEVALEIGSYVSPGNKIAKIVRTDQVELKVPIETSEVQWLSIGSMVELASENGLQSWKGQVVRIGDVVNQSTQSIDLFIKVTPNQNPIFDGLYLKAVVPGKTLESAMLLPRNAVFKNNQVYVIEQDSILRVKEINILKVNKETVVFNGLTENTDVVYEPLANAYNNMKAFRLSDSKNQLNMEVSASDKDATPKKEKKPAENES